MKKGKLIFGLLLFVFPLCAQTEEFNKQLLQNSIIGLANDSDGFLWASTQFGIYRYDGTQTVSIFSNAKNNLPGNRYGAIIPAKHGPGLLTTSHNQAIYIQHGKIKTIAPPKGHQFIFSNVDYLIYPTNQLPSTWSKSPVIGRQCILYFPSDTLLGIEGNFYSLQQKKNIIQDPDAQDQHYISYRRQNYYLNTRGIFKVSLQNNRFTLTRKIALAGEKRWIQRAKNGFWFQTADSLFHFNLQTEKISKRIAVPSHLRNVSEINGIWESPNGQAIYLGTGLHGLQKLPRFLGELKKVSLPQNFPNYIYTYTWHAKMQQFISATPQGIIAFGEGNRPPKRIINIKAEPICIYNDDQQHLWFSSTQNKLICLDPIQKKIIRSFLLSESVREIKPGTNPSNLSLVSWHHVFQLNKQTGRIIKEIQTEASTQIYSLLRLNHGGFWLGTNQGLHYYDASKNRQRILLPNETIRSLLKLDEDNLLIGTYSSGAYIYRKGQLIPLEMDEQGYMRAVVSLVKDSDESIWVICNRGAFIWDKNQWKSPSPGRYAYALRTQQELPVDELNGGQVPTQFQQNQIYLTTANGLLHFKKNDLLAQQSLPFIEVKEGFIHNLPASAASIELNLGIPYWGFKQGIFLQYRLGGLNQPWTPIPSNQKLRFERIPPGGYDVEVRLANRNLVRKIAHINQEAYWYQKKAFWLAAISLLGIVIWGLFKQREKAYRSNQVRLQSIIQAKTKDLQATVRKLTQSEKKLAQEYRQKNKLFHVLMHDLNSPLQFLSTYAIQQIKQPVSGAKSAFEIIAQSSHDLSQFIHSFSFWLGKQSSKNSLQACDVVEILEEVVRLYQPICELRNNKLLVFSPEKAILPSSDPDCLKIVLRNLIDNANKYTSQGFIKCSIIPDSKRGLHIRVEDSGIGLPSYLLKQVQEWSKQNKKGLSINANHKMGLQISLEIIDLLGGQLTVESHPSQGTSFDIHFS